MDQAESESQRAAMREAFKEPKKSERIQAITQDRKDLQAAWREIARAGLGQNKEVDELANQAMKAALARGIAEKAVRSAAAGGQSLRAVDEVFGRRLVKKE